MKAFDRLFVGMALCICIVACFSSCKRVAKIVTEDVSSESVGKAGKEVFADLSQKSIRELGDGMVRKMEWDDFLKLIKKEYPNLGSKLDDFSRATRKDVVKAMQEDQCFLRSTLTYSTLFDDFSLFTSNASKVASDVNLMRMYANNKMLSDYFGKANPLENVLLDETNGMVRFIRKNDGQVLASYRKGVIQLNNAFESGTKLLSEQSLLKGELLPNALYKIKGANGMQYLYHVDNIGRIQKIEVTGASANELMTNIINLTGDVNLGTVWSQKLRMIRQSSRGDDLKVTALFNYDSDLTRTPKIVRLDVSNDRGKKLVSESFKNTNLSVRKFAYTTVENITLLNKIVPKLGMSVEKKAKLLEEMESKDGLAALIHSDPEFNIKRWMNTRNTLTKNEKEQLKKLGYKNQVYAGNTFYFNPNLNDNVNNYIKRNGSYNNASYEELMKLDRKYPNGVSFDKLADPDFIAAKACYLKSDGKPLIVTLPKFTGDRLKDANLADEILKKQGLQIKYDGSYTWHHLRGEPKRMVLVNRDVHSIVKHTGGYSLAN